MSLVFEVALSIIRSFLILEVTAERLNSFQNTYVKEDKKKLELGSAKVEGPRKHSRFLGWVPVVLSGKSKGETEVDQSL